MGSYFDIKVRNVTELFDSFGNIAATYDYSPFGEITVATGSAGALNPIRFSSEIGDTVFGMVYYSWRHYNSLDGRFINLDSIGEDGGVNLYGFVGNDPVNRWDRLGLLAIAPVDDSPRTTGDSGHGLRQIWSSIFIILDDTDKNALIGAGGGHIVHGKRVSVNLQHCEQGEPIKKNQAVSKKISLSDKAFPNNHNVTQLTRRHGMQIYFNLTAMNTSFGNCYKGTIKVEANWGLYLNGNSLPTGHGGFSNDSLSGSLDNDSSHGSIPAYDGWPDTEKTGAGFSSGSLNVTIKVSCGGDYDVTASASPLHPVPMGRNIPAGDMGRMGGEPYMGWPWYDE